MDNVTLLEGNCLELIKKIDNNSIDLIVTSPPYDNLRTYKNTLNWNFEIFKKVANELKRVIKKGGVICWIVGDATIKGSETGTSFKQALYFKEIGLNLHDTMIYAKENYTPLTHNRYEQAFEYIFILSNGKPKTFNPIKVPCTNAGKFTWGSPSQYKDNSGELTKLEKKKISDFKIKGNIFYYKTGSTEGDKIAKIHPARFPEKLAHDQIISWSNEGDIVLDPFLGSGTTGKQSLLLNRNFVGIELVNEYFEIAKKKN